MNGMHNIEPSAFRKGVYVGYAKGNVYHIRKRDGVWRASKVRSGQPGELQTVDGKFLSIHGRTLASISEQLGAL